MVGDFVILEMESDPRCLPELPLAGLTTMPRSRLPACLPACQVTHSRIIHKPGTGLNGVPRLRRSRAAVNRFARLLRSRGTRS